MLCLYNYNGSATGNVYGAVIMIVAIARVHLVHLMNADRAPGADNPQTKLIYLDGECACRPLPSTSKIAIYYYYSSGA